MRKRSRTSTGDLEQPNLVEAHVELGKVLFHIGLTDKAVEANERASGWIPLTTHH